MTADKAEKDAKLNGLNNTLTSVENELLRKRADRSDSRYFDLLRYNAKQDGEAPAADDGGGEK